VALTLGDYLDLDPGKTTAQWKQVLARPTPASVPGFRQEPFTPVETLLCLAASLVVNHRKYGAANRHLAAPPVPQLAALFKRPPGSILRKMGNLDGTFPNGARHEIEAAVALLADSARFTTIYLQILDAARGLGVDEGELPDFLALGSGEAEGFELLGQDELADRDVEAAIERDLARLAGRMGTTPDPVTERFLIAAARVGQHRFAAGVLANCGHSCVFCGMHPGPGLERRRLLLASHIKPWRDSSPAERLDIANGVAACPNHDAAFDTGLLWVNGGLRIHASEKLGTAVSGNDALARVYGQPPMSDRLLLPASAKPPATKYLDWHRQRIAAA
jgi:putative restriction endonuclease